MSDHPSMMNSGTKHRASSRSSGRRRALSRGRDKVHYLLPNNEEVPVLSCNYSSKKEVVAETAASSPPSIINEQSSVVVPVREERFDRTLSLRTLSTDERILHTYTSEVFPSDQASMPILVPPCFLEHKQEPTIGNVSTKAENDTIHLETPYNSFETVKKKLRSKVLKSKIVSMRHGSNVSKEESSDDESKKRTLFILQNPSRVYSIKSETSTLQTPKITNKAIKVKKSFSFEETKHRPPPRPQSCVAEVDHRSDNSSIAMPSGEDTIDSAPRHLLGCANVVANAEDVTPQADDSTKMSEGSESHHVGDEETTTHVGDEETTTQRTYESSMSMPGVSLYIDFFSGRNQRLDHAIEDNGSTGTPDDDSLSTMGFPTMVDFCAEFCSRRMTRQGKQRHQKSKGKIWLS